MKRYDGSAWVPVQAQPTRTIPAGAVLARQEPARAADLVADLLVPIGQALASGALVAGVISFLAWRIFPAWGGVWDLWAGLGLAIAAVVWVLLLWQTRRLLWSLERLIGKDLNRDGAIGERIVVANAPRAKAQAVNAAKAERRTQFAQFIAELPTRGTDARTWEPEIGREAYQEYRDILIRLGWAQWKNRLGKRRGGAGWKLVIDPAEALERIG